MCDFFSRSLFVVATVTYTQVKCENDSRYVHNIGSNAMVLCRATASCRDPVQGPLLLSLPSCTRVQEKALPWPLSLLPPEHFKLAQP